MSLLFLTELFTPYSHEDGLLCEIRCIHQDREQPAITRPFGLTHVNKAYDFATHQKTTYDVYMGVLPRSVKPQSGLGGLDIHVHQSGWLWCDVDRSGATDAEMLDFLKHIKHRMPNPRLVVFSGSGGVHLYWKLEKPVSTKQDDERQFFTALLRRVVACVGCGPSNIHADKSCCNLSRILRLPNSFNHKHNPPVPVQGAICDDYDAWSLKQWDEFLPWEPLPSYKTVPKSEKKTLTYGVGIGGGPAPIPAGILAWADAGYPEGNRHHDIVAAAAWLRKDTDFPDSLAFDLLTRKARNSTGRRPITDAEIEKAWNWAAAR